MKKGFIRLSFLLVLLLGFSQMYAQNITIDPSTQYGSSADTAAVGVCQGDTLGVSAPPGSPFSIKAEVKFAVTGSFGFSTNSAYFFHLGYQGNSRKDTCELIELTGLNDAPLPNPNSLGPKEAHIVIPSNALDRLAYLLIYSRDTVSNVPNGVSDTIFLKVGRVLSEPTIDSISGGFIDPYFPTTNYSFCSGGSITLVAKSQLGANYQWLASGVPIPGENSQTLIVKDDGVYSVRMWAEAGCERDSKDTVIRISVPPTDITFDNTSGGFQIDNVPFIDGRLDSIQFCEDASPILEGPAPSATSGLTYHYQWLIDSIGPLGDTNKIPTSIEDTLITFTPDTTGLYYLEVFDGYCRDTSEVYYVFMDTMPTSLIQYQNAITSTAWGLAKQEVEICMRDSILLSTDYPLIANGVTGDTLLSFQWQRRVPGSTWQNVGGPGTPNPTLLNNRFEIQIDTSIKPIHTLVFYRLIQSTLTPYSKSKVCTDTTDHVVVRWRPVEFISFQQATNVVSVDNDTHIDSISFCARDTAVLIAPTTPSDMVGVYDYSYQWLKEIRDTSSGLLVKEPITGETNQTLKVNESGKYYVHIDDGICVDTLAAFYVFVDSIPTATLLNVPSTADRLLCLDEVLTLSANDTVGGVNKWNYGWLMDNGNGNGFMPLPADTFPWINIDTSYLPSGGDTLKFVLGMVYSNQFGLTMCPGASDTVEVVFFQPPTINFFPSDSIGVCPGDSVLVIAQGNSFTYQWSDGNVTADNWLSGAGTYSVTGTGINQCTSTRDIKIYDLVTVANAGPDVTIVSGGTAQLTATGGIDYQWGASKPIAWGNILSANTSVSYTLPEGEKEDTIQIYVKVSSSNGCFAYDTLNLFVVLDESPGTALIDQAWNVFTPDGNGKSDVWDISSITNEYGGCRIDIMNRWGSVVFVDESFNGIWDGTNNGGNPMPDGTYYYILSCDGEILLKNAVTIIRNQ